MMIPPRYLWASLLVCWLCHSCLSPETLDHDLDKIYTVEFYLSPNDVNGLVISNQHFPCIDISTCSPDFLMPLHVALHSGDDSMVLMQHMDLTYRDTLIDQIDEGDSVELDILVDEHLSWSVTEVMPEALDVVLEHDYRIDTPNNGLYIRIDTNMLLKSNGFYVLVITTAFSSPSFGFLIPSTPSDATSIPDNGAFISTEPNVYHIPQRLIEQAGIIIDEEEFYIASVRHITPGSYDFYLEFKRFLDDGTDGLSSDLLFAPPSQLPSNISYPGFGYFHVYQEQIISGVID